MDNESHVLVSAAGPKETARLIQVWIGTELLMVHVIPTLGPWVTKLAKPIGPRAY